MGALHSEGWETMLKGRFHDDAILIVELHRCDTVHTE